MTNSNNNKGLVARILGEGHTNPRIEKLRKSKPQ